MKIRNVLILFFIGLAARPMMAQSYKLGDVITNGDGSRGVVFCVHPDGGGWMVALDDASTGCPWGIPGDILTLDNQNTNYYQQLLNDTDGYGNTEKIRACQNNNSSYAAGTMDFSHGWYLPSAGQLRKLFGNLAKIEGAIVAAGGRTLSSDNSYWSSTEKDENQAWIVAHQTSNGYYGLHFVNSNKIDYNSVRAIHDFRGGIVYDTTLTYYWNTGDTMPSITVSPTQTTTYTVTATTEFGCSATAQQTVFVNPAGMEDVYDTVCAGNAYSGYGFDLTPEQTQTQGEATFLREIGSGDCTATLTLHLYKRGATEGPTITASICENEAYYYNGYAYAVAGTYHQYYTTASGCDSIITINLSVLPVSSRTIEQETCGSLTWNGQVYTENGTYEQTLQNQHGCDSVVTMYLTVDRNITHVISDTACGSYVWNGQVYDESGQYTQTFTSSTGCDSLVTLHLTLQPTATENAIQGSSLIYPSTDIVLGVYHYHIDSTGIDPSRVHWSIDRDDWLLVPHGANCTLVCLTDGHAELRAWTEGEACDIDTTIELNSVFFDIDENGISPMSIYPNPTRNSVTITWQAIVSVRVFDMFGQQLKEERFEGQDECVIDLRVYQEAVYVLEITSIQARVYRHVVLTR